MPGQKPDCPAKPGFYERNSCEIPEHSPRKLTGYLTRAPDLLRQVDVRSVVSQQTSSFRLTSLLWPMAERGIALGEGKPTCFNSGLVPIFCSRYLPLICSRLRIENCISARVIGVSCTSAMKTGVSCRENAMPIYPLIGPLNWVLIRFPDGPNPGLLFSASNNPADMIRSYIQLTPTWYRTPHPCRYPPHPSRLFLQEHMRSLCAVRWQFARNKARQLRALCWDVHGLWGRSGGGSAHFCTCARHRI